MLYPISANKLKVSDVRSKKRVGDLDFNLNDVDEVHEEILVKDVPSINGILNIMTAHNNIVQEKRYNYAKEIITNLEALHIAILTFDLDKRDLAIEELKSMILRSPEKSLNADIENIIELLELRINLEIVRNAKHN